MQLFGNHISPLPAAIFLNQDIFLNFKLVLKLVQHDLKLNHDLSKKYTVILVGATQTYSLNNLSQSEVYIG